jgi:hypothetical protein
MTTKPGSRHDLPPVTCLNEYVIARDTDNTNI